MLMRLDVEDHDDHAIIAVTGEIDASTSDQLAEAVAAALGAGRGRVLVDFAHVTFIDSSGLGVLVRSHRRADAAGARFAVVHPSPHTRKLIRVLGLDQLLAVYDSREQALAEPR